MKKIMGLIILSVAFLLESSPMVSAQSSSSEFQRQSLGVNVEETGLGLTVRSVIIGSAAVGQLEVGDVLQFLGADGHPVYATQTLQQMKMAKEAIGVDAQAYLQIQRGSVTRVFDVEFASSGTIIGNGRVMSIDDAMLSTAGSGRLASELSSPEAAIAPMAAPNLDFKRMITAEIQEGKDGTEIVMLSKPRWAEEKAAYQFTVTVMRPVEKERTVAVKKEVVVNGKPETVTQNMVQKYTVMIPETELRTGVHSLLKAVDGYEQVEISLDKIKAWNIDGNSLTSAELKSQLRKAQRVFILSGESAEYVADPYFTMAVAEEVLILAVDGGVGALPAILAQPAPNSPEPQAGANSELPAPPPAVAAPAPPAVETAPAAAEAAPSVAPPAEPELPSTETPLEGSSQEN